MKHAVFVKAGEMAINDVPKPTLQQDDDVIIRVVRTCVCGSDLWGYRNIDAKEANSENSGHEAIGIVDQVGSAITTLKPGDFVIAPFTHGCGQCAACRAGFDGTCIGHADNWTAGAQAEYLRFQHGQWALVKIPGKPSDYSEDMLKSLLTLSDVMATGYHAAVLAEVKPGDTAVVVGDGAVGLCGVIAAKMLGAKRIIAMSRHEDRAKLAKEFGATDIVPERGAEGVAKVKELTNGDGADAVLECVGSDQSVQTSIQMVRPGAHVGCVGVPHAKVNLGDMFGSNTSIGIGAASVTTYDKNRLLKAVLDGEINPGKVFTKTFDLDEINDAYKAMDERKVIKAYVKVSD